MKIPKTPTNVNEFNAWLAAVVGDYPEVVKIHYSTIRPDQGLRIVFGTGYEVAVSPRPMDIEETEEDDEELFELINDEEEEEELTEAEIANAIEFLEEE